MNEAAEIKKRWDKFSEVWPAMWRAFVKDVPGKDFKDDVWRQCQYLPVEAWDYVLEQFRDMDKPPRNWAKAIKGIHATWKQRQGEDQESFAPRRYEGEGPLGREIRRQVELGYSGLRALKAAVENCRGCRN
ncbi:hypothetical protein ACR42D_10055 [Desulfovibrio caledoniensis]